MSRIAFTICNYTYLGFALECEHSFIQYHGSNWSFVIALVDYPPLSQEHIENLELLLNSANSRIISTADIFATSRALSMMSLYYDITEYSTAIKPWLFEYLMEQFSPESVTYIDPDIQFFSNLDQELVWNQQYDCMVTPHILTNSLNSRQQPTLQNIRSCGAFNFGFVHFAATSKSKEVLGFWKDQLIYNSLMWLEENLFTDQRYGDIFPSLCRVFVNQSPSLNVAYWNLQERLIFCSDDGTYQVCLTKQGEKAADSRLLIFFHFSGLRPSGLIGYSTHGGRDPRSPKGSNKALDQLCSHYLKITNEHRERILRLGSPNPLELIGAVGYQKQEQWHAYSLDTQVRRHLNRLLAEKASAGIALLPPSRFLDEDLFVRSIHGISTSTDECIRYSDLNLMGAIGLTIPGIDLTEKIPSPSTTETADINIIGYPNFSFGIGRITAVIMKGLNEEGIRFSFTCDPAQAKPILDADLKWIRSLTTLANFNVQAPSLFLINADQLLHYVKSGIANHCFSRTCNLGYWWWELETPVSVHFEAAPFLDKVLAPTRFIYESLHRVLPKGKLIYAPLDYQALYKSIKQDSALAVTDITDQQFIHSLGLDLDLRKYDNLTLCVFDFHSCIERKNPGLLIDIFSSSEMKSFGLILKCSGGASFNAQYLSLIDKVTRLPNVFLLNCRLSELHLRRLFSLCQVYASPHRAEGLGLNIIEADAFGLATVSTNYGGISDYPFFGPGPHHKCRYKLVPVHEESAVYQPYLDSTRQNFEWAEPDPEAFRTAILECLKTTASNQSEHIDQRSSQSETIVRVIVELLRRHQSTEASFYPSASPALRSPAALAVASNPGEAKRQLFWACRDLLVKGRDLYQSTKHMVHLTKLITWHLLRVYMGPSRYSKSLLRRASRLKGLPSFRKIDVPPS